MSDLLVVIRNMISVIELRVGFESNVANQQRKKTKKLRRTL